MLKLRNAVLTALLAFCLAMPFVSCSFNDGATGDVSNLVRNRQAIIRTAEMAVLQVETKNLLEETRILEITETKILLAATTAEAETKILQAETKNRLTPLNQVQELRM